MANFNDVATARIRRRLATIAPGAKVLTPTWSESGWPDRLIVSSSGKVVWVEMKSRRDRIRPAQEYILSWLKDMGHAVVIYKEGHEEEALKAICDALQA